MTCDLLSMYERLVRDTDPISHAVRQANVAGEAAKQLEKDALESGAMKGEIRVMLRFTRGRTGAVMAPFLV